MLLTAVRLIVFGLVSFVKVVKSIQILVLLTILGGMLCFHVGFRIWWHFINSIKTVSFGPGKLKHIAS